MHKINVDVYLSLPPCSGGMAMKRLIKRIEEEYGDKVEFNVHTGPHEMFDSKELSAAPAMIIGDLVRFMGVCPSYDTMVASLREAGL